MENITLIPVGYVKNNRNTETDDNWSDVISEIILNDDYPDAALDGIDAFSHLEIIFYFNRVEQNQIVRGSEHPRARTDLPKVGIFAQRKKERPNLFGTAIVRLIKREGKKITVKNLDAINGTPVVDIKPVMSEFLPKESVVQPDWSKDIMKQYWKNTNESSAE